MLSCWFELFFFLFAVRVGIIYILSAFVGALMASLFLQSIPSVGSSGALFGLLGTLLSEFVWNWKFHTNKVLLLSFHLIAVSHYSAWLIFDQFFIGLNADFKNSIISLCFCVQLLPWFSAICRQFFKHWRFYIRIPSWNCSFIHPSAPTNSSK